MAATNPPNPTDPVISVSTDDISTVTTSTDFVGGSAAGGVEAPVGPANDRDDDAALEGPSDRGAEQEIWEGGYDFGNFAGRLLVGFAVLAGLIVSAYYTYALEHRGIRPIFILTGLVATIWWLYLAYRIVRARLGHHYRLTTNRLFVSSGIFRRHQDMMELDHLKEVAVQQHTFMDHVFKIGTVVVTSNVQGAPTLFLLGIKYPQQVTDKIYHHARDKSS